MVCLYSTSNFKSGSRQIYPYIIFCPPVEFVRNLFFIQKVQTQYRCKLARI